jgi:hypothetical protein
MNPQNRFSLWLVTGWWMLSAIHGETRPNFTGTWEFVSVEHQGRPITFSTPGNKLTKETTIFAHQEPKLKIKMLHQISSGLTPLSSNTPRMGKPAPSE